MHHWSSHSFQDIVDWFNAIRSAKLNRLTIAYPGANVAEVSSPEYFMPSFILSTLIFFKLAHNLTHSFIMEGWLSKTGPRQGDAFRRRWFTLEKRKLMYYDDPLVKAYC
jgi:hypothetical protein